MEDNKENNILLSAIILALIAFIVCCCTLIFTDIAWSFLIGTFNVCAIIIIAIAAIALLIGLGQIIQNQVTEFNEKIESQLIEMQKSIKLVELNFGAEILAILSGLMIFLIQEILQSSSFSKIISTIVITILNVISIRLIRSGGWKRFVGVLVFLAPLILLFGIATYTLGPAYITNYFKNLNYEQIFIVTLTFIMLLLTLILAFSQKVVDNYNLDQ